MLGDQVFAFRGISIRITLLILVSQLVGCKGGNDTIRSFGSTKNLRSKGMSTTKPGREWREAGGKIRFSG